MEINRFVLGTYATNCYVVSQQVSGPCVLIDPADGGQALTDWLLQKKLVPQAVLLTHGHYDHYLAVPALQAQWPQLPVYCHPLDVPTERFERDMGQVFPTVAAFENLHLLQDGQHLTLAGLDFQVLHTPGHTPGSVVFLCSGVLFSGDTLFFESIGRTDFAGGDMGQMTASLRRLSQLDDSLRVLPGHEQETTMAHEKRFNPWLQRA